LITFTLYLLLRSLRCPKVNFCDFIFVLIPWRLSSRQRSNLPANTSQLVANSFRKGNNAYLLLLIAISPAILLNSWIYYLWNLSPLRIWVDNCVLIIFTKLRQSLHGLPNFLTLFPLVKYLLLALFIKLFLANFRINIAVIWRLVRFIFFGNNFFRRIHELFFEEELVYWLVKLIIFGVYLGIGTARIHLHIFNYIHYTSFGLLWIRFMAKNWKLFCCVLTYCFM